MTLEKIYNKWLSIQPLSEADQNKLSMRFTVEYNYNSNHLEGNTLTYGQTELLLLFGKVSGEGHLKDFNDMKACEVSVKMMKEEADNKIERNQTRDKEEQHKLASMVWHCITVWECQLKPKVRV